MEIGQAVALMAPTELLADSIATEFLPLVRTANVEVALLSGRRRQGAARRILDSIAMGDAGIVVGTHALLKETWCSLAGIGGRR